MKRMPLKWLLAVSAAILVALLVIWLRTSTAEPADGREPLVFNAGWMVGDDIYGALHRFEQLHPEYRVTTTTSTAQDQTGDAQRLLLAIAGGVPPDVVFFDRFAVGEWAAKSALEDLTPFIEQQDPGDPSRIDLRDYYPWAVEEASFRPPGSVAAPRLYGIPTVADARMLYTNVDLLRQEGLVTAQGQPQVPTTWEELRQDSRRLSRYRVPGKIDSGLTRLGFAPVFGDSFLYMFAFEAGGHLLSQDGLHATMDSPPVVRALRYMTDVYDDLGGVQQANAFQQSFQNGPLDPFIRGQVAMKIDGNWYLETLGDWKPDMNFAVTPAPVPADQLASGRGPVTWASGWALVIPTTSRHKKGAFELIRYLRTWTIIERLEQSKRERKQNEGRLYLPNVDANRKYTERLFRENVFDNPAVPGRIQEAYRTVGALLENPYIRPVTPVGQLLWRQQVRAYEAAVGHKYAAEARATGSDEIKLALATMQEPVQRQLDALSRPLPPHVVDWRPYIGGYTVVVLALIVAALVYTHRRRRSHG
ncbi:MAG: multiple sugar transport system permease protein, partial [Myxococcales bacterium]|nr:multiple sugar transport system permease protein [Myxococcales bacterium]